MRKINFSDNQMLGCIFVIMFLTAAIIGLTLTSMDVIWNYGFSAKIALGFVPYRDFDVLIAPFSFYVIAIFLKMIGNYLIVYTMLGALFTTLIYYIFYKILFKLSQDKKLSIYLLLIVSIYTLPNFFIYTYNSLYIVLALSVLWLELNGRISVKSNVVIGILLATIFLTKQSIGIVTIGMSFFTILISNVRFNEKVKMIFLRILPIVFIVGSYILYLYLNHALYDFIDHAFLGVRDFSAQNSQASLIDIVFIILPCILILKGFYVFYKQRNFDLDNRLLIILPYAVAAMFMVYPILDVAHASIGCLIAFVLIPLLYKNKVKKANVSILLSLPFLAAIIIPIMTIRDSYGIGDGKNESVTYKYTFINRDEISRMNNLKSYILENKDSEIVFADTRAMAYLFYLDIYDNKYDLLIRGNVGLNGEEKMLNRIKSMDHNTLFFMAPRDNYQTMNLLREYIACYYDYVETISNFSVYKKPIEARKSPSCHYPE